MGVGGICSRAFGKQNLTQRLLERFLRTDKAQPRDVDRELLVEIESSWWGQRAPVGGLEGPPRRTKVWKDWKPQRSHQQSWVSPLGLDLTGELKPGTTLRSSQPEGPPGAQSSPDAVPQGLLVLCPPGGALCC